MGFLDNSGDIVLDAVLTDAGRQRLARADGTFKVAQFALGDDEINYGLYDKNNVSGSAYYDLSILQTPIFEAFTNNIASLNSKLLTIPRNDLLYLPVLKLNTYISKYTLLPANTLKNSFIVLVDKATEDVWKQTPGQDEGVFYGYSLGSPTKIQIDQGLDSAGAGTGLPIDSDLKETQYIIEIDNRLGIIHSENSNQSNPNDAVKSFVDDDGIAQYYFSFGVARDKEYIEEIGSAVTGQQVIAGPKGTKIMFKVRPSLELATSTYLFDLLGINYTDPATTANYKVIRSNVIVTGATTGYSITIPVSYVKYTI